MQAILDIFQPPKSGAPEEAFVAGAGQWFWFKDQPTHDWTDVFHRMGSWSPWNMVSLNSPQVLKG
jgi:hypothetical protein